jgi:hypothetical protein
VLCSANKECTWLKKVVEIEVAEEEVEEEVVAEEEEVVAEEEEVVAEA